MFPRSAVGEAVDSHPLRRPFRRRDGVGIAVLGPWCVDSRDRPPGGGAPRVLAALSWVNKVFQSHPLRRRSAGRRRRTVSLGPERGWSGGGAFRDSGFCPPSSPSQRLVSGVAVEIVGCCIGAWPAGATVFHGGEDVDHGEEASLEQGFRLVAGRSAALLRLRRTTAADLGSAGRGDDPRSTSYKGQALVLRGEALIRLTKQRHCDGVPSDLRVLRLPSLRRPPWRRWWRSTNVGGSEHKDLQGPLCYFLFVRVFCAFASAEVFFLGLSFGLTRVSSMVG